jgi:hypothetical protein
MGEIFLGSSFRLATSRYNFRSFVHSFHCSIIIPVAVRLSIADFCHLHLPSEVQCIGNAIMEKSVSTLRWAYFKQFSALQLCSPHKRYIFFWLQPHILHCDQFIYNYVMNIHGVSLWFSLDSSVSKATHYKLISSLHGHTGIQIPPPLRMSTLLMK